MDATETLVYGERLADLLPALVQMSKSRKVRADGMHTLSFALPPEDAAPFQRALLRAEAELMLEDADDIGSPAHEERSYEQRAADALLRLVTALPANG